MKQIIGTRCNGKTVTLVAMSIKNQIPIVVLSISNKRYLKAIAKTIFGSDELPEPILVDQLKCNSQLKKVYIDDSHHVLNHLFAINFGVEVEATTQTLTSNDIIKIGGYYDDDRLLRYQDTTD